MPSNLTASHISPTKGDFCKLRPFLDAQCWCPVYLHHFCRVTLCRVDQGTTVSFCRTPLKLRASWDVTLGTYPAFAVPLLLCDILIFLQLPMTRTEFWWGEKAPAKFICNLDTEGKSKGIMCCCLKCEIISKWRPLKAPKVEKTFFVSWSRYSVQSARSTQVITFTTNGASHSVWKIRCSNTT